MAACLPWLHGDWAGTGPALARRASERPHQTLMGRESIGHASAQPCDIKPINRTLKETFISPTPSTHMEKNRKHVCGEDTCSFPPADVF
ncbi:Hypothetical predicted protein [Scomber scombrus]|uniref:Uncharacterized protein n=1 Tax=Scomber scombrus TaxID=13677 RepID=A0AAV1NNJ8_SCOSC